MEDDTNENREKVKMKKKSEVKIEQLKVIRTIGTGTNNISTVIRKIRRNSDFLCFGILCLEH